MALACVSNTSSCTTLKPGHKRPRLCRTKSKPQSPSRPCLGHRHWPFLGAHTCGITQRHSAPQTHPVWASMAGATHQPPRVRRSTGTHQALLTSTGPEPQPRGGQWGMCSLHLGRFSQISTRKSSSMAPTLGHGWEKMLPGWALARAGSYDLSNSGDQGTEMPRISLTGWGVVRTRPPGCSPSPGLSSARGSAAPLPGCPLHEGLQQLQVEQGQPSPRCDSYYEHPLTARPCGVHGLPGQISAKRVLHVATSVSGRGLPTWSVLFSVISREALLCW